MSPRKPVTDDELSEYVDGGLSEARRAEIADWLLENPKKAAEVERLRQLNEALRGLGAEILDEPVPDRLRDVVRRERQRRGPGQDDERGEKPAGEDASRRRTGSGTLKMVAACAILALGGAPGWGAHPTADRELSGARSVLADAGDSALGRGWPG